MRGHIRRRGDGWTLYYDRPADPLTGRRRKTSKAFRTRKEAERWFSDYVAETNRGVWTEPTKETVAAYLTQRWLPAVSAKLRPSTLVGYKIVVEQQLVPRIGNVPLQRLTPAELNGLYGELLATGRRDGKGGLSARSVRIVHTVLRKALADAVRWGLLPRNVADSADPPSAGSAEADAERARHFWTPEQLLAFLHHVRPHRLHAAFRVAALTGMRRGEVLGLRWQDLDFERGRLSVRQTLIAPRYKLQLSRPKNGKTRVLDLDEETLAVLRAHRAKQAQERLAFGPGWDDHEHSDDLVFRNEDGSPVVPHLFTLAFLSQVKKAGLPQIRLHDLRHTHASLLALSGAHPKVVQERLGHHDPGFTLRVYSHVFPSQQRDAVDKLVAGVLGAGPSPRPADSP